MKTLVSRYRSSNLTPLASGFCFGRSPRWFEGLLWFSDALAEVVHTVDLRGTVTGLPVPGHMPFGLGFRPDGSLLIVSSMARQVLHYDGETISTLVDLSKVAPRSLGDMVVDGLGRAFVGCQARDDAVIIGIDPDGAESVVAQDLQFPSGMAVTSDNSTLIVAESTGRRLTSFSIGDDGRLSDRRPFAENLAGPPDGIALDADGAVWVAMSLIGKFQRILPGGEIADQLEIGDRAAVGCTLGGPGGRQLFTLSSSHAFSELLVGSTQSRLDVVSVDVPAAG